MRGDFGARIVGQGRVEFRLWAPDAHSVSVVLAGQKEYLMDRDGEGVFSTTIACGVGARYKYKINDLDLVPDPASRAQDGDVHDDSIVTDVDFSWQNSSWRGRPWHETVVYELHVGAFGGFKGVARHLPRLKSLGVTAIELMPIADFPGRHNWGYDGVLPFAPDTAYGTPAELAELIDAAHGLGLQVFLDVVYNHFGPDGNYLSSYAARFVDDTVHTPWGGAINFKLMPVRRFFIENALYWLGTFRFDGLRFDAVHAIANDEFLLEMAAEIRDKFADRRVHLILENENNEPTLLSGTDDQPQFNAQWTDDWHHCLHVLLTGEHEGYYGDFQSPEHQLARCLAEGFAYQGETSRHAGGKPRGRSSVHLPPTAFVICLQNHDQVGNRAMGERLASLAHPDALRAAMLLLLLTPQIPMLFMGEEWGEVRPFLFFTDHGSELADAVREGRRKEFAHFAAFTQAETREKIPDPNAPTTFAQSIPQLPETLSNHQAGLLRLVEHCLALRRSHLMPILQHIKAHDAAVLGEKSVRAEWRFGNSGRLTIAANFGESAVGCVAGPGRLLISSIDGPTPLKDLPPRSTCAWFAANE
jgi:maltooligosyltrehalose trehalohydrolase